MYVCSHHQHATYMYSYTQVSLFYMIMHFYPIFLTVSAVCVHAKGNHVTTSYINSKSLNGYKHSISLVTVERWLVKYAVVVQSVLKLSSKCPTSKQPTKHLLSSNSAF